MNKPRLNINIKAPDVIRRGPREKDKVAFPYWWVIGGFVAVLLLGYCLTPRSERPDLDEDFAFDAQGHEGRLEESPFRPIAAQEPSQKRGDESSVTDITLSKPIAHENLAIFLVESRSPHNAPRRILTLQQALDQRKIIVHETGDVSALAVQNLTDDTDIYIQSGDIVKGGQQDRTFPSDTMVPPKSGRQPIASLCVEHGRWQARGDEASTHFSSSTNYLATRRQRLAVLSADDPQSAIWTEVSQFQNRLEGKLGQSVYNPESESSLQLSLEARSLKTAIEPCQNALKSAIDDTKNAVGCVVVINGRVSSADIYASPDLFRQVWPRLLESASIEAFMEHGPGREHKQLSIEEVQSTLKEALKGKPTREATSRQTYVQLCQSNQYLRTDTCDRSSENRVIHRSILARD